MEYIWNITGRCDLNCKYCWDPYKKCDQLSYVECCSLIDKLVNNDCSMLIFTGGEPTMHDDFFDIVQYAFRTGINNLKICTNGFKLPYFRDLYVQSALNEIHISVNSAEEILKREDVNEFVNALRELKAANKKVVFVAMINVISQDNYISVLKLAEKLGINVMFQFMAKTDNNKEVKCLVDLTREEKEIVFRKIEVIHSQYKKYIDPFAFSYFDVAKKYYLHGIVPAHCYAGTKYKVISPKGEVSPCYWKKCKDCSVNECFTDKCLVWFRYNKRVERVYQMIGGK